MSVAYTVAKLALLSLTLLLVYSYGVRIERQLFSGLHLGGRRPRLLWPLLDVCRALRKPAAICYGPIWSSVVGTAASFGLLFVGYAFLPVGPTLLVRGFALNPTLIEHDLDLVTLLILGLLPLLGTLVRTSGSVAGMYAGLGISLRRAVMFAGPLLLSWTGCALLAATTRLSDLLAWQASRTWLIFYQPLGFLLACVCIAAGGRRLPIAWDQETTPLIEFHLQHAGGDLALDHMLGHWSLFWYALVLASLFWGGWHGPLRAGIHWLGLKGALIYLFLLWLRCRWVTLRLDELGDRFWLVIVLLSVANLVATLAALLVGGGLS